MRKVSVLLAIVIVLMLCVSCDQKIQVYRFTVNQTNLGEYDSVMLDVKLRMFIGFTAPVSDVIGPDDELVLQSIGLPTYTARGVKDGVISDVIDNTLVTLSIF